MSHKAMCTALAVAFAALTVSVVATASAPADLLNGGDLHESVWQADTKDLAPGVTYTASTFPLALRLRSPDARWEGVQLQSGTYRFVQFNHLRGKVPVRGTGYVTLEARAGRTGSVAATVQKLHATPLIKAGPVTSVRVAGFRGKSFDATITGEDPGHYDPNAPHGISLAPFTTNRHCGWCSSTMQGETQDVKFAQKDELFRIMVIGVRGKTVVIYLESAGRGPNSPSARVFPTFLPYAKKLLASMRFPA
jgi:hypothetical protein